MNNIEEILTKLKELTKTDVIQWKLIDIESFIREFTTWNNGVEIRVTHDQIRLGVLGEVHIHPDHEQRELMSQLYSCISLNVSRQHVTSAWDEFSKEL